MSNWSDTEKSDLIKKLVRETSLGRDGEIHKTLKDILDAVKHNDIDYDAMAKSMREALKSAKSGGDMASVQSKAQEATVKRTKADLDAAHASKDLKKSMSPFEKGIRSAGSGFDGLVGHLKSFTGGLSGVTGFMLGMTTTSTLTQTIKKSTDVYREFYSAGMTFNGSMLQMHIAAADASMSLSEYKDAMIKNSDVAARLGGPQAFGGLIRQSKEAFLNVGMLGMTSGELVENLGEYYRTMSVLGPMDEKSRTDSIDSFKDLIQETTALSSITGRNRREMLKNIQDAAKNTISVSRLLMLPKDEAEKAQKNMSMVNAVLSGFGEKSGSFFTQSLAEAMGEGGLALSTFGTELAQAGLGNMIPVMDSLATKVIQGTASQDDAAQSIEQFQNSVKANLPALHMQARAGNAAAKAAIDMYTEMNATGKTAAELAEKMEKNRKEQEKLAPMTKFFQTLGTTIDLFTSKFKSAFLGRFIKVFDNFQGTALDNWIKNFPGKIEKLADHLGEKFGDMVAKFFPNTDPGEVFDTFLGYVESFGDFLIDYIIPGVIGLTKAIGTMIGWVREGTKWVVKSFGGDEQNANAIGTGMAGLFVLAAPFLIKTVVSLFGNLLKGGVNLISGLFGGKKGGAGEGIESILGGIGSGVGKVLSGLAEGLKSLGDPKVLLGIAGLAGIGASMWVAGKALQEFASVNWDDLGKAGVVLVALMGAGALGMVPGLAPGVAAMGAALIVMGGALWVIGKAIEAVGNGFVVLTPQLKVLSEDINADKLKKASDGLYEFGKALIPFGIGGALIGLLTSESTFKNLVEGLKRFEDLDPLKLTEVAKAMGQIKDNLPSVVEVGKLAALDVIGVGGTSNKPAGRKGNTGTPTAEGGPSLTQAIPPASQQTTAQTTTTGNVSQSSSTTTDLGGQMSEVIRLLGIISRGIKTLPENMA
jgi:hypothetical protein